MNTFKIDTLETSQTSGSFRMSPLPDHFGITLGNALRRVLLSAVPGGAVFSIRIDGVFHEFTGIKGVTEDVAQLILQIKQLILKIDINDNDIYKLRINAVGPCTPVTSNVPKVWRSSTRICPSAPWHRGGPSTLRCRPGWDAAM